MRKKGQLFLIEVIIAVTVLIVLVSALFAIQSFSPPPSDSNLKDRGDNIIENIRNSGILFDYFDAAFYSFYILKNRNIDNSNSSLFNSQNAVVKDIDAGLSSITNFKAFTERFNDTTGEWERLDTINFEVILPRGNDIVAVEYYTPGYNGVYAQFKFILFLWYEVS